MIIRIAYNNDTGKTGKFLLVYKKIQVGFSSKINVSQLGSATS